MAPQTIPIIIASIILAVLIFTFVSRACRELAPELPLPMSRSSQEPEAANTGNADVNNAQDGRAEESVPPPPPGVMMNAVPHEAPELPLPTASSQEPEAGEASDADINKAPPYSQDGGGEDLVPPPPGVMRRDSGESDLGRLDPSTLLPMYMDRREVTVPVRGDCTERIADYMLNTLPPPGGTATTRYRC